MTALKVVRKTNPKIACKILIAIRNMEAMM